MKKFPLFPGVRPPDVCVRVDVYKHFFPPKGIGSDASSMTTKATKSGSGYILNGTKSWITNAKESTGLIVFATIDTSKKHKGISSFLVKKNFPGEMS